MEDKQCIICLEDANVYTITDFLLQQPLLKACECVYNIHEECIKKWIKDNPTCPYCKNQLYLEHQQSISIIDDTLTKDHIVYTTTVEKNTCIRKFLLCICIIMLGLILSNIFFN